MRQAGPGAHNIQIVPSPEDEEAAGPFEAPQEGGDEGFLTPEKIRGFPKV